MSSILVVIVDAWFHLKRLDSMANLGIYAGTRYLRRCGTGRGTVDEASEEFVPHSNDRGVAAGVSDAPRVNGAGVQGEPDMSWPRDFASIVEWFPAPFILLKPIRDQHNQIVDFEYRDANKAACDFFVRSHEEIVGMTLSSLFTQLDRSPVLAQLVQTFETGDPIVLADVVVDVTTALGGVTDPSRYYDMYSVKVDGGITLNWYEVTGQHELLTRYQMLAENVSDVVYQTDMGGTIEWVSPSVTRVLGWQPEDSSTNRFPR